VSAAVIYFVVFEIRPCSPLWIGWSVSLLIYNARLLKGSLKGRDFGFGAKFVIKRFKINFYWSFCGKNSAFYCTIITQIIFIYGLFFVVAETNLLLEEYIKAFLRAQS
jgi:hypothetical protein